MVHPSKDVKIRATKQWNDYDLDYFSSVKIMMISSKSNVYVEYEKLKFLKIFNFPDTLLIWFLGLYSI